MIDMQGIPTLDRRLWDHECLFFLGEGRSRILIDEYIISLTPRPPHPQPQTHRVSGYRALAHGSLSSLAYGQAWPRGVSQNPPVIEKIGKTPLSVEARPPPPPSEARRQNFRVF